LVLKKSDAGVRVGKERFEAALLALLREALHEAALRPEDLDFVAASGMITSALGLLEVPHLKLPVSVETLAAGIQKVRFHEFEIHLIPGIKKESGGFTDRNRRSLDVIRGEETEVMGIMETLPSKNALLVLPGSHNKFIETADGKIMDFITTLSGELLEALTKHTILRFSVEEGFAEKIDPAYLLTGCDQGLKYGINQAAFQLRGLDLHDELTASQKQNYLLGLALSGDILVMQRERFAERYATIHVAGGNILAMALSQLMRVFLTTKIKTLESEDWAFKGALRILRNLNRV